MDADGLLTSKECDLVDSWIRPQVYGAGSELAPALAFKQLVRKSLSGLKWRYNSFPDVKTTEVVWGWAALEEELDIKRICPGGGVDEGWRARAQVTGGWTAPSLQLHFPKRTCALYPAVQNSIGVTKASVGASVLPHSGVSITVIAALTMGYPCLFYADVLFLTFIEFCYGDVLRKTALQGDIDWGWWDVLSPDLELYYAAQAAKVLRLYVTTLRNQPSMGISHAIQGPIIILWCIDFCCGFQSRREACMLEMQDHVGCGTMSCTCRYIGLDIAAVLIAGTTTFVPDLSDARPQLAASGP